MENAFSSDEMEKLVEAAIHARSMAYAPYSHFQVGAALMTDDGTIFEGCNIENISFTPTVCGERVAFFQAIAQGYRNFKGIVIITNDTTPTPPCGVCRQVMAEFVKDNFQVILANDSGERQQYSYNEVFPLRFVPEKSIGKQQKE